MAAVAPGGAAAAAILFAALPRTPSEPRPPEPVPVRIVAPAAAPPQPARMESPRAPETTATLRVEVEPKNARVTLDGDRLVGPELVAEVEPSDPNHRIEVSAPGFEPRSLEVRVTGDQVVHVRLNPLLPRRDATTETSPNAAPTKPEPTPTGVGGRTTSPPWGARKLDTSDPW